MSLCKEGWSDEHGFQWFVLRLQVRFFSMTFCISFHFKHPPFTIEYWMLPLYLRIVSSKSSHVKEKGLFFTVIKQLRKVVRGLKGNWLLWYSCRGKYLLYNKHRLQIPGKQVRSLSTKYSKMHGRFIGERMKRRRQTKKKLKKIVSHLMPTAKKLRISTLS